MIRRIIATLTLAVIALLALPALAMAAAPDYPAPSVAPESGSVLDQSSGVASPLAADQSSVLASTGAGFGVGTAVAIGVAVLLVGLVLIVVGNRVRKASNS